MQRTDDAKMIGDLGQLRKEFTDLDARDFCHDRRKQAAIFEWGVRLWVPGVELRRSAPEPQQYYRLCGSSYFRPGTQAQQVGQRQAEHRAATGLQEGAARQRLAGSLLLLTDEQHDPALLIAI